MFGLNGWFTKGDDMDFFMGRLQAIAPIEDTFDNDEWTLEELASDSNWDGVVVKTFSDYQTVVAVTPYTVMDGNVKVADYQITLINGETRYGLAHQTLWAIPFGTPARAV